MSGRRYSHEGRVRATAEGNASRPPAVGPDFVAAKRRRAYHRATEAAVDPVSTVATAAVTAARALVEGTDRRWNDVRATTIATFYCGFAAAAGMRVGTIEGSLPPVPADVERAVTTAVRSLPYADLTAEHFGHVHETLAGYGIGEPRALVRTDGRRAGGVHFTPRSLTAPIVAKTLEPLLPSVPPENTLDLRICDPAVGAGAFLLELVRQLGERAHAAGLAADLDAAKRLVAIHCAYGVDICPFGVATARLALTLECRADRMPTDWLHSNLRVGDALVGLNADQLSRFHWSPSGKTHRGDEIAEDPLLRDLVTAAIEKGAQARRSEMVHLSMLARSTP